MEIFSTKEKNQRNISVNTMPNKENLIPHRFKKGQSGNPIGRPKKFVTLIKDQGYKQCEITDICLTLLACNVDELKEVCNDHDTPLLEKTIAAALLEGLRKKSLLNLDLILNRAVGKPKETQEVKAELNVKAFKVAVVKVDTPFANNEADIDDGWTENEKSENLSQAITSA